MGKLADFLGGVRIFEEVDSPINGHIVAKTDFAWGPHIQAGGLTQSGGVVETVWKSTLIKLQNSKTQNFQNVLILGLGGGTIAKLVHKNYPSSVITGVDIDPLMVNLGKKYLGLANFGVDIKIQDAQDYLKSCQTFGLICIDLYTGDRYPDKFESEAFLELIRKRMTPGGVAIFNRLYYGVKRPLAMKFLAKLEKVFGGVEIIHPEANILFLCERLLVTSKKRSKRPGKKK